ncbi:MAG TPA: glycoside hydrolase family 127 protein, partial [Cyclobacteriaceae bacterium]|nr:glycoside hydrolase family 127 protein [Cyclobacteriaceae bacterium]
WDGKLVFHITPKSPQEFNLHIRIPGWSQNQAMPSNLYTFTETSDAKVTVSVNGKQVDFKVENGFAKLSKTWKKGDVVEVNLPMPVRKIEAIKNVKSDIGRVSLQRGPLVYCAEWPDNQGKTSNLILPENTVFTTEFKPELLQGVTVINGEAIAIHTNPETSTVTSGKQKFVAIPYYAWAHRGKGEMAVWFPTNVSDIDIIPK